MTVFGRDGLDLQMVSFRKRCSRGLQHHDNFISAKIFSAHDTHHTITSSFFNQISCPYLLYVAESLPCIRRKLWFSKEYGKLVYCVAVAINHQEYKISDNHMPFCCGGQRIVSFCFSMLQYVHNTYMCQSHLWCLTCWGWNIYKNGGIVILRKSTCFLLFGSS